MWEKSYSIVTKEVTKEQIWQVWQDVKNWNSWDEDVIKSEIFGEFTTGTKGYLVPKGGPKTKFVIIDSQHQKSFSDRSLLPFCKLDFVHTLEETQTGLKVTHQIEISGLLGFLFVKVIGQNAVKNLPIAMKNLLEIAKNK